MTDLTSPLTFAQGPALKNRSVRAPLTNQQSHADGRLSEDEIHWLSKRAEGGFGLTMTAAAQIDPHGIGFPGQLGCFDDAQLPGLRELAAKIDAEGSHSVVQLHHAGMRTPHDLIEGKPVCPSDNEEFGARAMTLAEVEQVRDDFIAAAMRCEAAGFHGVEVHGAHGYLLCQFLSAEINTRDDRYGGSLENRARLTFEIINGIRAACGPDFSLGLRLSPERFGMDLGEVREVARRVMAEGRIDYLDMSLWDVFKTPVDEAYQDRRLVDWFTDLPRGDVKLGAAGKLLTGAKCHEAMRAGLDFVVIGRGAILHHDFPDKVAADPDFEPAALPVSRAHLAQEGLGEAFINYMSGWKGFVEAA
jgi:2,4-dienoyl-CoA reductase-like NADH-dependent reductase (Old Yellow Enzyme family)